MSNQINSLNWTIDNFSQSIIYPPLVSADSYRNFLYSRSLPGLDSEIQKRVAKANLDDRNQEYQPKSTIDNVDPGGVTEWFGSDGSKTTTTSLLTNLMFGYNKYQPQYLQAYEIVYDQDEQPINIGGTEYKIAPDGILGNNVIGNTFEQLGLFSYLGYLGPGSLIDYDSPLQTFSNQRRLVELQNKLIVNTFNSTIGNINLDPFNLLQGGSLFSKDYTITKPGGALGVVTDFTMEVTGFYPPISTLVGPLYPNYDPKSTDTLDGSENLLKNTGDGVKSLLQQNLKENRYKPKLGIGNSTTTYRRYNNPIENLKKNVVDPNSNVGISVFKDLDAITICSTYGFDSLSDKTSMMATNITIKNKGNTNTKLPDSSIIEKTTPEISTKNTMTNNYDKTINNTDELGVTFNEEPTIIGNEKSSRF